jgi:hypothetical protein
MNPDEWNMDSPQTIVADDMYYNNGITQCSGLNVSYLGIYIPLKPKCSTLFAIWNLYNN